LFRNKFWAEVGPIPLTLDGTVFGEINLSAEDAAKLREGQIIFIQSSLAAMVEVRIEEFASDTKLIVSEKNNREKLADLQAYLVADAAYITAPFQTRKQYNYKEHGSHVFETEPVVAYRTTLVDFSGKYYGTTSNPVVTIDKSTGLKKRLDDVGGGVLYLGEALPGTSNAAPAWKIQKIECVGLDVNVIWANSSIEFVHVWDDRLTYSYN